MVDILIGGDVSPIGRSLAPFTSGDASAIFNDLLPEFESADFSIVDLEGPLTDSDHPVAKSGPHLKAPTASVNGLAKAGISAVTLANNHTMDYGPGGLRDTLAACERAGVLTVGAGRDLAEARHVLVRELDGLRLGVMAVAEHEFGIATADSAGVNPIDPVEYVRSVRRERGRWDHLIVLMHGGNEGYPYPSPRMLDLCRFMVEEGATAVVCQHTHVAGAYEAHEGGHIIYGQGNLIFDYYGEGGTYEHEGFLLRLSLPGEGKSAAELIPYVQSTERPGARRMSQQQESDFRAGLDARSARLKDERFLREEWARYCAGLRGPAVSRALAYNRVLTWLNKKGLAKKLHTERSRLLMLNAVRSEAHREVLLEVLEQDYRDAPTP